VAKDGKVDGVVLADVGGTNVRFAVLEDGKLGPVAHMAVADYQRFSDALAAFISDPKSLTLTLDAKRPVKFSELGEIRSPDDLMELVDLDAKSGP